MSSVAHDQNSIFLETTVQIGRIIGNHEERSRINRNIYGQRLCTSGHVLAEFNHTLIKDATTFRNLLLTSPDVGEAVKRFGKYSQNRKFPRLVFLLATLGFDNDKQNILDRLQIYIEWKLHDLFWESVDQKCYVDGVKCTHRQWQAEQKETGDYDIDGLRCLKSSPPTCDIVRFIEMNRSALEKFVDDARSCPRNNVCEAAGLFETILNGTESPFGIRNCYTISDTLIVLEAPSEAEVYSTDGDIHAICDIVGKCKYSETP
ncbi:MAG: hypothetical protein WBC82_03620 [Dehalococcoidia bacterium]